jgi:hypothetical protein
MYLLHLLLVFGLLYDALRIVDYTASKDKMTWKYLKGTGRGLIEVLFGYFPGGTAGDHQLLQSG